MKISNKCDYCWKRKSKPEFKKYCSKRCKSRAKRYNKTTTYCQFCGKKFHVKADSYNFPKYCSTICRRKGRKRSGTNNFNEEIVMRKDAKMPARPTNKEPGSVGKIKVMKERLYNGECLFHPEDKSLGKEILLGNYLNFFTKLMCNLEEQEQNNLLKMYLDIA